MPNAPESKGRRVPAATEELIEVVHRDVVELRGLWATMEELYRDPAVIRVLDDTAPVFFVQYRDLLTHALVMRVRRLLDDDPKAVTLHRLRSQAAIDFPEQDLDEFETLLAEIEQPLKKMLHWRHEYLAHRAEHMAISTDRQKRHALSYHEVQQVVTNMIEYARGLRVLYTDQFPMYSDYEGPGVKDLLDALQCARHHGHRAKGH